MASGIYERFKANLMNKIVNLGSGGDTIKVALLSSSHSFTATHNTWSQLSTNDIGTKVVYTISGTTLAGQTVTQAATTKFAGTAIAWGPGETFTAAFAVLYDDTLANDDLICCFDFGGDKTVSNGTFTITWHADGIITLA